MSYRHEIYYAVFFAIVIFVAAWLAFEGSYEFFIKVERHSCKTDSIWSETQLNTVDTLVWINDIGDTAANLTNYLAKVAHEAAQVGIEIVRIFSIKHMHDNGITTCDEFLNATGNMVSSMATADYRFVVWMGQVFRAGVFGLVYVVRRGVLIV